MSTNVWSHDHEAEVEPGAQASDVEVLTEDELLEEVYVVESPADRPGDWYVVHTQSGYEKKVKQNLEARITSMNMEERIFEAVIPMEDVEEFKNGKKIVVQKDGGRLKTRGGLKNKQVSGPLFREIAQEGQSQDAIQANASLVDDGGRLKAKRKGKRTFDSDWREPKLAIIYVVDENGKQEKGSKAWIEGTLEGPDTLAELVAMRLFQLGASQAKSITFVSDGAPAVKKCWDVLVGKQCGSVASNSRPLPQ